ncbi:MAG TPA: hypothetical protein VMT34_11200, partial [Aggregatilineales bacterium]|nr:hypothetical protein [Aggregatilineales bacterium]
TDVQPFLRLNEDYPGQVGIYRAKGPKRNRFGVFLPPYPQIDWRWDEAIYLSTGDDFREAIHEAVARLNRTDDDEA